MLRNTADRRTVAYMAVTTGLFVGLMGGYLDFGLAADIAIYVVYLFMSIAVTVIAHNHNHLPIWKSKLLNHFTDYWLTVFYGFPAFAWIPTHNQNHHRLNNREGDYTITYRITENNTLLMILFYPMMSSFYQQKPIRDYLGNLWRGNKKKWMLAAGQYAFLGAWWVAAFYFFGWEKALLYVIIPQQVGLFSVLVFNYVQHVHADEESPVNHSRNFVGGLNYMLFNNGYHTVHHDKASSHWSNAPKLHAEVADKIDPQLIERSFWWYIIRVYFLGPFVPKFRTKSMRLERIKATGH